MEMSKDVRRSAKSFLQELSKHPEGIQLRHMVFAGSSGDNALRTRNVLSQGGYVQLVLIDGYHGSKITDKGTSFLRYLMGQ